MRVDYCISMATICINTQYLDKSSLSFGVYKSIRTSDKIQYDKTSGRRNLESQAYNVSPIVPDGRGSSNEPTIFRNQITGSSRRPYYGAWMALAKLVTDQTQLPEQDHTSDQRCRALARLRLGPYQGGRGFKIAACTIHGASRQKFRRGNFWPFILAHCEVAEPSICGS